MIPFSLGEVERSATILLAWSFLEILLLPLSKKSSVFPHHSESAPSSPSPFPLLCESPGGNRHHNYRQGSRIHSSKALATLLKERVIFPFYLEEDIQRRKHKSPGICRKQHKISTFRIQQRFCKRNRNPLKLTEGHTKRPTASQEPELKSPL